MSTIIVIFIVINNFIIIDLEIDIKLMDEMWDVIKESDVVYPSTGIIWCLPYL